MMKRLFLLMILGVTSVLCLNAQTKSLHQLQQEFVDLRCGMFMQTMGKSGKISQHDLRMSDNETS